MLLFRKTATPVGQAASLTCKFGSNRAKRRNGSSARLPAILVFSALIAVFGCALSCAPGATVPLIERLPANTLPPKGKQIFFHRKTFPLKLGVEGAYFGPLYLKLSEVRKDGIIVEAMASGLSIGVKHGGRQFKVHDRKFFLGTGSDGSSSQRLFIFNDNKWTLIEFKYAGKDGNGAHLVEMIAYLFYVHRSAP